MKLCGGAHSGHCQGYCRVGHIVFLQKVEICVILSRNNRTLAKVI